MAGPVGRALDASPLGKWHAGERQPYNRRKRLADKRRPYIRLHLSG
jgi:hypothetical protein